MSRSHRVDEILQVVRQHAADYRADVVAAREEAARAKLARGQLRERIANGEFESDTDKVQALEEVRGDSRTALAGLEKLDARGPVLNAMAEQSSDIFSRDFGDDESIRAEVQRRAEGGDQSMKELRRGLIELDSWWGTVDSADDDLGGTNN